MSETKNSALSVSVGENDHARGAENAPVTLVEYGDYQCSDCGEAYPVIKEIQEKMGDKLQFVFRNFPLTHEHQNALCAAEAVEIAASQGRFWEMHDILYEHQNALDNENLTKYAGKIGLDVKKFAGDLQNDNFAEKVRKDHANGVESGVSGTPTFFINGTRYDHGGNYENLRGALESF